MKVIVTGLLLAATAAGLAGCQNPQAANAHNFGAGMRTYLAERGRLCLAKRDWPVDVTPAEFSAHGRNAIQMPVLAHLGLASVADTVVTLTTEERSETVTVKRYALTDQGKQFYVARVMHADPTGALVTEGDLCAGTLSLDKVVHWDDSRQVDGRTLATVSYTYRVDAAPWMKDELARGAFPVIARLIDGAGKNELKEDFVLTPQGWRSVDLPPLPPEVSPRTPT
jgi:hypothetical protein